APGQDLCAQCHAFRAGAIGLKALDAFVRSCTARGGADVMNVEWTSGNSLELLENGEVFFPAAFEAIREAKHSVVLETFILFEDKVGLALQQAVIEAARRGVRVDMTVDGYGSADLTNEFIEAMTGEGVAFHVYDPRPKRLGVRTN